MKQNKVVIIGGGVIGAFIAYFLRHKGWQATIVEKGQFGSGSSEGNCGLIVPNHVFPLNSYGNLLKAFKGMLSRDAPLHVKPRLDPGLFQWFVRFSFKCGQKDVLFSAKGRHALLQSSFNLYPSIVEKEGLDCDWEVGGSLHAHLSEKEWRLYAEEDAAVRKFGIAAEKLDRRQMLSLEPSLAPDLCGGWYYPQTAHLCPEKLLAAMHGLLAQKGVIIHENAEVTGFDASNDGAHSVRLANDRISADVFVVAAGAWSPQLQKELGCRIPIQPGKGYSITVARPERAPALPCFFAEKSVVATPWPDGFRLGGTMEFSGFDDSLDPQRLAALSRGAEQYLQDASLGAIEKEWCGFRPMTCDGLPIISWSPRLQNVVIAAGHNMLGLSMGPGTGKLVAEMINHEKLHIDPQPYSLKRFN
ncbi:MAG: FAD-dependent oxidoreductase [Thermodesulfobacteriota bacterium]